MERLSNDRNHRIEAEAAIKARGEISRPFIEEASQPDVDSMRAVIPTLASKALDLLASTGYEGGQMLTVGVNATRRKLLISNMVTTHEQIAAWKIGTLSQVRTLDTPHSPAVYLLADGRIAAETNTGSSVMVSDLSVEGVANRIVPTAYTGLTSLLEASDSTES